MVLDGEYVNFGTANKYTEEKFTKANPQGIKVTYKKATKKHFEALFKSGNQGIVIEVEKAVEITASELSENEQVNETTEDK